MKKQFLLIHASRLTASTPIYHVWAGTTRRDVRICMLLDWLARTNSDYYFKPWSADVDDFLTAVAKSLDIPFLQLNSIHLTAQSVIEHLPTAHVKNLSLLQ